MIHFYDSLFVVAGGEVGVFLLLTAHSRLYQDHLHTYMLHGEVLLIHMILSQSVSPVHMHIPETSQNQVWFSEVIFSAGCQLGVGKLNRMILCIMNFKIYSYSSSFLLSSWILSANKANKGNGAQCSGEIISNKLYSRRIWWKWWEKIRKI